MDSDICFPTLKLVWTQITYWILSKSVRSLLEAIFEFWTSSPMIKSAIFKTDVLLSYRQNNVSYIAWQTYTSMYGYINLQ